MLTHMISGDRDNQLHALIPGSGYAQMPIFFVGGSVRFDLPFKHVEVHYPGKLPEDIKSDRRLMKALRKAGALPSTVSGVFFLDLIRDRDYDGPIIVEIKPADFEPMAAAA